jgi:hypothetical protein
MQGRFGNMQNSLLFGYRLSFALNRRIVNFNINIRCIPIPCGDQRWIFLCILIIDINDIFMYSVIL